MSDTYELTPTEQVTIRRADDDLVEVEVLYQPGSPPPKHWHPTQSEHFEVLEGTLRARVDGAEHTLEAGDTLEIPAGAVHQMWNETEAPVRAVWQTTPGGRTAEWFRVLGTAPRGKNGMPGLLTFGALLTEYRDVFRLAGPDPLLRTAFAFLGAIGGATGRTSLTPSPAPSTSTSSSPTPSAGRSPTRRWSAPRTRSRTTGRSG